MNQARGLRVAAVVFGLMALAPPARLILRPEIIVAGHLLPLWLSLIAFLLLAALSIWLCRLSVKP